MNINNKKLSIVAVFLLLICINLFPDSGSRMEEQLNLLHELDTRKVIREEIEKIRNDKGSDSGLIVTIFGILSLSFVGYLAYKYTVLNSKNDNKQDTPIVYHIENAYFTKERGFSPGNSFFPMENKEKDITPKRIMY